MDMDINMIPLNWRMIGQPLNWLIVLTMVLIAAFGAEIILQYLSTNGAKNG